MRKKTKNEHTPEEKYFENIKNEVRDVILNNTIEYALNKFKEMLPEWREKFQNWKNKYFS